MRTANPSDLHPRRSTPIGFLGITEWIGASLTRKVGAGLAAMVVLMLLAIGGVFLLIQ